MKNCNESRPELAARLKDRLSREPATREALLALLEAALLRSREQASTTDSEVEVRRFQGEARAIASLIRTVNGGARIPTDN